MFLEGIGGPVKVDGIERPAEMDPTLDSCCIREMESNAKQNALMTTLRRHDRIALAERRRRNVLNLSFGSGCRCCYDPNQDGGEYDALIQLRQDERYRNYVEQEHEQDNGMARDAFLHNDTSEGFNDESNNSSDDDSDDEYDYLLEEDELSSSSFQQQRMEELQLLALIRESAMQHGFGVHRQFHPQRVLQAAGLGMNRIMDDPPGMAVVHLYDAQSTLCASLDLCLEKLGETYRGTKFLRSNGRSVLSMNDNSLIQKVFPNLSIDSDIPALIAVKDGVVVAVCPKLSSLGEFSLESSSSSSKRVAVVEPNAVEQWLDRAGVLLRNVPIEFEDYCRIRPEEDALLESCMREKLRLNEKKKEETLFNCGVSGCHKSFPHEHVGIRNSEQSGLVVKEDVALGLTGEE
mmetsp:Transcript_10239/g.19182  ORF Transcript_10239/g.19182 Transcript_10239/m.19182 type:complete len:405 (-) Transcript_10239:867-2081(-)